MAAGWLQGVRTNSALIFQGDFDTLAAGDAFLLIFVEEDAGLCEGSHIAASGRDGPVLSLGVESGEEVLDSVWAVFTAGTVSAPSLRLAPSP